MIPEHLPTAEKALEFLRAKNLWPHTNKGDAKKLEDFLDSLPHTGAWSGFEFNWVITWITNERAKDPLPESKVRAFIRKVTGF